MSRYPGRRRLLRTLAAGGTLLAGLPGRQAGAAPADGGLSRLRVHDAPRPLPEGLRFADAEGRETGFDAFRGRALVVNFWATWCAPCVAEMPSLDRLQARAEEGIEVLALSSDRGGRAQVEPFYQRTGLQRLKIWLDARGATGRALGVRVLPSTLIIDRQGREVARLEGEAAWDHPDMVAAIRRLAGPAPAVNQDS